MDSIVVEFDIKRRAVVSAVDASGKKWMLRGKCLRCGECCEKGTCPKLVHETLDGKPQARCGAEWSKPWMCAVYPNDPHAQLDGGCGYWWEPE